MEVAHTLDFSRLRVLENIKISALGSQRALNKELESLEKSRLSLVQRLERAQDIANGVRSYEPVNEGLTGQYDPQIGRSREPATHDDMRSAIKSNWEKEVRRLEAELAEIDQKKKSLTAERDEVSERFNEAGHLYDACKKFVGNMLNGDVEGGN
ncbi:hypothetical protein AGR7C_Cc160140 [Agrobacterium deltaense Zutra 3/1]|uniref:Uncharacterized protein n=1 Tax=Agrobacterium deltaense Zutra 3/1 TaxID=1183427 RepID=A0A1S7PM35_9HYPH|nr:hypothetical protein [Agrobacterium deltaense]CUX23217.1 hypothetical protein AGR7C_Cc160140 [Agrobacterium deltaense Zutra 3/1]